MRNKMLYSKVFFYVYFLFIIFMIIFGFVIHHLTGKTVERQMANKCAGIAIAVATMLEQDIDGYRNFSETLDTGSDYYKNIKKAMEEIRQGNEDNVSFVYTEKKVSATHMAFVLDGEPEDAPDFSPPGHTDLLTPSRIEAYHNGNVSKGTFVTTQYGTLLSSYAPIKDRDGEVLGLVGVDMSIDQYRSILRYMMMILAGSIALLILMGALALLLSSNRIEKLITIDSLTGAYNKSYFLRSLRHQAIQAKKKDVPLLVIMADLDHFKKVNDTYGHPFGDKVLTEIANAVKLILRESDCLARYGGEEFAAYFPGMTKSNAMHILERIRQRVEAVRIYNNETNEGVTVTISIGAAFLGIHQTINEVLEDADKALYRAKVTRNAVVFYSPDSHLTGSTRDTHAFLKEGLNPS